MHRTIFDTPVLNTALRGLARAWLALGGWQVQGALPAGLHKCVVIAAPHTSNWDLPYTLGCAFVLRMNIRWMGKASLFNPPFGALMRWFGGIPVDRSRSHNLVSASAAALVQAEGALQLVVPPEGTRGRTRHWKTGFYYIALEARVPIVLAYLDYGRKCAGLGPVLTPSGDIEADMVPIKRFYADVRGRNATQFDAQ
jgi:1-acyl-sn-glycerol-3-phosphate acyltransferase